MPGAVTIQPCPSWDIGPDIGSLTLRAVPGLPVTWALGTVDGWTPQDPVFDLRFRDGSVRTFPLTESGGAWTASLTASDTEVLQHARHARLRDGERVIAAGRLRALSGWDADCTGGTVPVRIVAGAPGRGIVSISAPDEAGVATVTYTDGTIEQLAFPTASGGVSMSQVAAAIAEALSGLSSGGAVHLGEGPPPDLIVGAVVGDVYIDTVTGTIYALQTGA